MNRVLYLIFLLSLCTTLTFAQQRDSRPTPPPPSAEGSNGPSDGRPSFMKFLEEKTTFIITEMGLPEESSQRFRELYGQMQQEKGEIMRKYSSVHRVMNRKRKGETITEQEYLDAVRGGAQRAIEDAALEARYLQQFEAILTPEQLFQYILAEQRFQSQVMERRGARKRGGQEPPKGPHAGK